MHPAEVRVGTGADGLRGSPGDPLRRGGAALGAEAEVAGVEPDRAVGERVGDAGGAVAGRATARDRVEDVALGVAVDEAQRLAGADRGRAALAARHPEVALAVDEPADRDRARLR